MPTISVDVKIVRREFYPNGAPQPGTEGAAAVDLVACIDGPIDLNPGEQAKVPLGLALDINDPNWAALLLPRSGRGSKGLVLGNLTGLIDSDYQGELQAALWNRKGDRGGETIRVEPGERVVQMTFVPVGRPTWNVVDEFKQKSERGEGGFGSTGL